MKNAFLLVSFLICSGFAAQEKINFENTETLLKKVQPEKSVHSWILISSQYGTHHHVASSGKEPDYNVQASGFSFNNDADHFYYYVVSTGAEVQYITDKTELRKFIGTIDNAEEVALKALLEGYFLDEEFKNVAGNYSRNKAGYTLELAKITSDKCPFAKSHYEITAKNNTSAIEAVKNLGVYFEVYDKSCENNPHYSALDRQIDAAKAKNDEEAIKNKEMKAQMKKKLMKSMRRN